MKETEKQREHRWMVENTIVRCKRLRKHKPKRVRLPVLEVEGLPGVIFLESEIESKSKTREETDLVRKALMKLT